MQKSCILILYLQIDKSPISSVPNSPHPRFASFPKIYLTETKDQHKIVRYKMVSKLVYPNLF